MYRTVHMRLPTARTRDNNEETAQNGVKWHIYNKEKPRRPMFMRFPVMPCATRPVKPVVETTLVVARP